MVDFRFHWYDRAGTEKGRKREKMYHILVVEDDRAILDGVGIYLKNQGYKVFKAQNGKEGLEILAKEEIHLAIVDIMMPVMDARG